MDKVINVSENQTDNVPLPLTPPPTENLVKTPNLPTANRPLPKRYEVVSVAPISQILQQHLLRIGLYRPFVDTIEEEVSTRELQAWEAPKDMPYPPSTPSSSDSEVENVFELEIAEVSVRFEEIDLDTIQVESEIEDPLLLDPLYQSSPRA